MRTVGHGLGVETSEGLGVSRRHGVTAMAAAALVTSACLAGCSGGDSDNSADSGLPSKSESTTPTAPATETTPASATQPPELPDLATRQSQAGARAFARFYIDLLDYAQHTGDVQPLVRSSSGDCAGCNNYIDFFRDWYERGGWIKRGDRSVRSFERVFPSAPPHDMYLRVAGQLAPGEFLRRKGAEVKHAPGETLDLEIWLARTSNGWRVSRLEAPQ